MQCGVKAVKGCAGYGAICSPSTHFVNVGSSHYLQLHLQPSRSRSLIEILIEKISHFCIAYWDCSIKQSTGRVGEGGEISFGPRAMEIFIENYYGIVYWRGALSGQSYA